MCEKHGLGIYWLPCMVREKEVETGGREVGTAGREVERELGRGVGTVMVHVLRMERSNGI